MPIKDLEKAEIVIWRSLIGWGPKASMGYYVWPSGAYINWTAKYAYPGGFFEFGFMTAKGKIISDNIGIRGRPAPGGGFRWDFGCSKRTSRGCPKFCENLFLDPTENFFACYRCAGYNFHIRNHRGTMQALSADLAMVKRVLRSKTAPATLKMKALEVVNKMKRKRARLERRLATLQDSILRSRRGP